MVLLTGWKLYKFKDSYYIDFVHFNYLEFICSDRSITLIAPSQIVSAPPKGAFRLDFRNLTVADLPNYSSYAGAIFKINSFLSVIKKYRGQNFYCRFPDPFSWAPLLLFNSKTTFHIVGDPVKTLWLDKSQNIFKRSLKILIFLPELLLFLIAARKSNVFCNGKDIKNKYGSIIPNIQILTSSSLTDKDFPGSQKKVYKNKCINICYMGYLRYPKGVMSLIDVAASLKKSGLIFKINVVGDGEAKENMISRIDKNSLTEQFVFHGHINDRSKLNYILRDNDFFLFPSLSEGSPRAVLEAMAQGLFVISTQVGSLSDHFIDREHIRYFESGDINKIKSIILYYYKNQFEMNEVSHRAQQYVKRNLTRDRFLKELFNEA